MGMVLVKDLLVRMRIAQNLTQTELAEKLGCTASHISIIEGGKSSGRKKILPSDDMLRRIAQCLGGSPLDVQRRTYQLLVARAREVCSPEVAELLDDQILTGMPAAFLERVKQDLSEYSDEELAGVTDQVQLGGRFKQVLSGIGRLSQAEVERLAQVLGQSSETYLVEAGYLSESARLLFGRNPNCVNILQVFGSLRPETQEELLRFGEASLSLPVTERMHPPTAHE